MPTIQIQDKPMAALKIAAKTELHRQGVLGLRSQVVGVFDVSGSMEFTQNRFYSQGVIQQVAKRVLALGLNLDDNGSVPIYRLHHSVEEVPEELTATNIEGFIDKHFRRIDGGTAYSPTINKVVADLKPGDPALVFIFTDGDCSENDEEATRQALIRASSNPIFFMFFGIYGGGRPPAFRLLKQLDEMQGRKVDNAGFMELGLFSISDEELMASMIREYKDFPAKCKALGMLPWTQKFPPHQPQQSQSSGRRWPFC